MKFLPFSAYESFVYLLAGILVLVGMDQAFNLTLSEMSQSVSGALVLGVVAYVTGHVTSHVSTIVLTTKIVRGRIGDVKETILNPVAFDSQLKKGPLARWFKPHIAPLDPLFHKLIAARASTELEPTIGVPPEGWERFVTQKAFVSYCFSKVKHHEIVYGRWNLFSQICDFSRNTSFALGVVSALLVGRSLVDAAGGELGRAGVNAGLAACAATAALFLFSRYVQFFRYRLAEILESYAVGPASAASTHEGRDSQDP